MTERDYEPIQPHGTDWRGLFRKITAPIIFIGGLAIKLGSLAKLALFAGTVWIYAKIWGWEFGVGVVALIYLHELGHYVVAHREGLKPDRPVFLPIVAYVRHQVGNPWQMVKVASAGPIVGGVGAIVVFVIARLTGSLLLQSLAFFTFFLNAINLIPVPLLDGGTIRQSTRWLRQGGAPDKARIATITYWITAVVLILGAIVSYVPKHQI